VQRSEHDGEPDRARHLFEDRINQIDLRIAKIVRVGHTKTQLMLDVDNMTNTDPADVQPDVRTPRTVADADVGAHGAIRQSGRADRLLVLYAHSSGK
jgi:hypothetical protein